MYSVQKYQEIKSKNSVEIGDKGTLLIKEIYRTFIGEYDESIYSLYYKNNIKELNSIRLLETKTEKANKLKNIYFSMKSRCYNPNSPDYKRYGARGISVCEEWRNGYRNFLIWALTTNFEPNAGLELDREDNDGNYEPSNCRFIPKAENCRNSRATKLKVEDVKRIRYGDLKDTHRAELAEIFSVKVHTIDAVIHFRTFKEI